MRKRRKFAVIFQSVASAETQEINDEIKKLARSLLINRVRKQSIPEE